MVQVMTQDGIDRRTRFIMAVAVCVGIGVTISPGWATNNLWNVHETTPAGVRAIRYSLQTHTRALPASWLLCSALHAQ